MLSVVPAIFGVLLFDVYVRFARFNNLGHGHCLKLRLTKQKEMFSAGWPQRHERFRV